MFLSFYFNKKNDNNFVVLDFIENTNMLLWLHRLQFVSSCVIVLHPCHS